MLKNLVTALLLTMSFCVQAFDVKDCEVKFSPKGGTEEFLVKYIRSAVQEIYVQAYNFTDVDIAKTLVAEKESGVFVKVILDKSNLTAPSSAAALKILTDSQVTVAIDSKHRIAHNKIIIVDPNGPDPKFQTGSYNYSESAETSNAENALVCRSKDGAKVYLAEWLKHFEHSKLYQVK